MVPGSGLRHNLRLHTTWHSFHSDKSSPYGYCNRLGESKLRLHRLKHLADAYIQQSPRAGKWPYDAYAKIEAYREVLVRQKDWDALPRNKHLELLRRI
jgi:hypothetical protein